MNKPLALGVALNITVAVVVGIIYSDVAIETALVVKGVFNLSLRALEGFTTSVFQRMDVPLTSPSYSCISKRAKTVNIKYRSLDLFLGICTGNHGTHGHEYYVKK